MFSLFFAAIAFVGVRAASRQDQLRMVIAVLALEIDRIEVEVELGPIPALSISDRERSRPAALHRTRRR